MIAAGRIFAMVAVIAALTVPSVRAADLEALKETTPKERAAAQTMMLKSKLDLTEAQTPKIAAINMKYAEKMDPIIKGSQGPLMKARAAKGIEAQKEAELRTVLTPDQFQKFEANKGRDTRADHGPHHGAARARRDVSGPAGMRRGRCHGSVARVGLRPRNR